MRFHNFWCISFVSREFLNHVQKTPKSWGKICQITIFHQDPEKHFYRLEKPSKLPFFFPPLFQTIMDKSLGTLLRFWGVFQFTQVQPLPSPHKQCWTRVSRIFFRVSTLYRVGEARTARKFRKRCTVLRGNRGITKILQYCPKDFCPGLKAMNSVQVREGKSNTAGSPFLPRRKESTAIAWSIAHQ